MKPVDITYTFTFGDGQKEVFQMSLDPQTLLAIDSPPDNLPDWTLLDYHQCDNCPLNPETSKHCPMAARLVRTVSPFERLVSFDEVMVQVDTSERTILQKTSVQRGLSSLMGLIIATCGCPHTTFFRSMARFHLPLATVEESLVRAVSYYLLGQYFAAKDSGEFDFDLTPLTQIYANIHTVNTHMARRLSEAGESDSTLNGLVKLDLYTIAMPNAIDKSLTEMRYLFDPILKQLKDAT